ncbi:MAG: endonuclease/exonuclease/phosphatase family protein [Phycisphaerales bacterium]
MRILFWNVNHSDLTSLVCSLAESTSADVIVLNENSVSSSTTLDRLHKEVSDEFFVPRTNSEKRFHCFCRHRTLDLREVHSGFRISVRNLNISGNSSLLALVHGVDIQNYDTEERQSFAQTLASELQFAKQNWRTNQLIVMGDFNMNPFDRGMNLAAGLNAMMTKACASAGTRRYLGQDYDLYYNPMWSYLGDLSEGPAGTIYDTSRQGPYGWSMLDQVILSYSTLSLFEGVRIITAAGASSLLDGNGRPDSVNASNHLPVLLELRDESNV